MQDFSLSLDDILNENLMPLSLVMLESDGSDSQISLANQTLDKLNNENQFGTFDKAFNSMGFHRTMINNFLCSKFVAKQIVNDFKPFQLKNRFGTVPLNNNSLTNDNNEKGKINMLFDEGSNQYQNWLKKTTTLNDIYRNMEQNREEQEMPQAKTQRQDEFLDDENDYKELFEEGEVTGYMAHKLLPQDTSGINSFNHFSSPQATAGEKQGPVLFDDGKPQFLSPPTNPRLLTQSEIHSLSDGYNYPSGYASGYSFSSHHPPVYGPPVSVSSGKKSISIKDLFDIALTTLAFLSFGMFIIQVFMCIAMSKHQQNEVMLPMEMIPASAVGIDEVDATEMEVRSKRSIKNEKAGKRRRDRQVDETIKKVDEISLGALKAIDAFIHVHHDGGNCLKRVICENNKFSRTVVDIQRFTIPLFGVSLSYMANQINNLPMITNLGNIHASIIGLGNGDCQQFKCDSVKLTKLKKLRK